LRIPRREEECPPDHAPEGIQTKPAYRKRKKGNRDAEVLEWEEGGRKTIGGRHTPGLEEHL